MPATARLGWRGGADGCGTTAQVGRVWGLVPSTVDRAGQFQGLLVTRLSLGGLTAEPVQCRCLIDSCGLTTPRSP
jgi:hypothetical protein